MKRILEVIEVFSKPQPRSDSRHLHLLVTRRFVDSPRTLLGVRRLWVQTPIERAFPLATIAPAIGTSTQAWQG